MGATSLKRSGLKAGAKYFKSLAGNTLFAWLSPSTWVQSTPYPSYSFSVSASYLRNPICWNFSGEGLQSTSGPGSMTGFTNYGASAASSYPSIGYSSYAGSWNGWFLGSGNYSSSSLGYKKNVGDGWTYITGYSSYTGSGGIGTGGFTSAGIPIWVIPVTTGSVVHGVLSTTMPTQSWTLNTVGTFAGSSAGYLSKVAIANDVIAYAYHSSSTLNANNLVIKYASITPSTGAISATWNTATFDFALSGTTSGTLLNLVSINGTFLLTTNYGDVYTSTNGATFTRRVTGTTVNNALQVTTESDGYVLGWLAASAYSAQYSTDGINWTATNQLSGTTYTIMNAGIGKGVRHVIPNTTTNFYYRNF